MLSDISGLLTTQAYPAGNDNPYSAGISKCIQTKLTVCKCSYNYGLTLFEKDTLFSLLSIGRLLTHVMIPKT
jgi:hypothetical protein